MLDGIINWGKFFLILLIFGVSSVFLLIFGCYLYFTIKEKCRKSVIVPLVQNQSDIDNNNNNPDFKENENPDFINNYNNTNNPNYNKNEYISQEQQKNTEENSNITIDNNYYSYSKDSSNIN